MLALSLLAFLAVTTGFAGPFAGRASLSIQMISAGRGDHGFGDAVRPPGWPPRAPRPSRRRRDPNDHKGAPLEQPLKVSSLDDGGIHQAAQQGSFAKFLAARSRGDDGRGPNPVPQDGIRPPNVLDQGRLGREKEIHHRGRASAFDMEGGGVPPLAHPPPPQQLQPMQQMSTAVAPPPTMQQLEVVVPAGVRPGEAFTVEFQGSAFDIFCPDGVGAGSAILVELPVSDPATSPAGIRDVADEVLRTREICRESGPGIGMDRASWASGVGKGEEREGRKDTIDVRRLEVRKQAQIALEERVQTARSKTAASIEGIATGGRTLDARFDERNLPPSARLMFEPRNVRSALLGVDQVGGRRVRR